ncbi:MAG: PilN domain-containing protein [Lysobacterales bacterium]|jgi:type IV pilus assembly protein PilN
MARINLLPWREEARRERQRQFMYSLVATIVLGAIIVLIVGVMIDQSISDQEARNQRIQVEISRLEQRITRISQLEETRARLVARKQIIESLQASRSLTVEMLDKLAKTIPPGVTLTNVRQQGMNLTLLGTSASNAMVSEYLQNLEAMDLFVQPDLQYVRVFQQAASRVERYEFSISVRLDTNRGAEDEASVEDLEGTG